MKLSNCLLCAATAILLSACGGGDNNPSSSATTPTPPTNSGGGMTVSPAMAFISYLEGLVVSMADTQEPIDTSAVVATIDNTGEPVTVN